MLIVTGHMHVDPADLAQFTADLKELAAETRKRPGCISYDAAADDPHAARLLISERWADQAALSAHLLAADTIAFIRRWSGKMRGDIRKYDAFNERDIMDDAVHEIGCFGARCLRHTSRVTIRRK